MAAEKVKQYCPKCKRTMDEGGFYTYADGSKVEFCKKCQTMHIDNFNPETFIWILKDMNVPYIEAEWNTLRDRYKKEADEKGKQLTGMSIIGRYLSKMKLTQWKDYTWADTVELAEKAAGKASGHISKYVAADLLREQFEAGEISEAEFKTLTEEDQLVAPPPGANQDYPVNHPGYLTVNVDISADLDDEDKIYLAMKWGQYYTGAQWVWLEKMYTEMHDSFDIQGAAREDTMKKLCKTSLKMEDAIDNNNIDEYQKLNRVYESLSKAGKFTEAQNKEDGKNTVNSIGELVAICESELGFIPKYVTDVPQDIVDKTLQDMNRYTYNLVTKDMGLGQQIEDAIKKIQIQQQMDAEEDELNTEFGLEDIEVQVLSDVDHEEYYEEIETQRSLDDGIVDFLASVGDDE